MIEIRPVEIEKNCLNLEMNENYQHIDESSDYQRSNAKNKTNQFSLK